VLDPFVSAPLFSLFCALNTGSPHVFYAFSFLSAALAQTQLLHLCLYSLFVFYFVSILSFYLYFISASGGAKQRLAPLSALTPELTGAAVVMLHPVE
jgi:hypothetical protein